MSLRLSASAVKQRNKAAAAQALARIGPPAVEVLLELEDLLSSIDQEGGDYYFALLALAATGDSRGTERLREIQRTGPAGLRAALAETVRAIESPPSSLIAALSHERTALRQTAVQALAHRREQAAASHLVRALADPAVALEAIGALGKIDGPVAKEALASWLTDISRCAAVQSVQRAGWDPASALTMAKVCIASAAGEMGDRDLLERLDAYRSDSSMAVRAAAALAAEGARLEAK